MEDNQKDTKVLEHGVGTPYLAIFNGVGDPILDPRNGMPVGMYVTDFEYIYDEEKEDEGTITIDTDNPNLIDIEEFRTKMPLKLQWGWLFADGTRNIGPVRKVMITDHDFEGTTEGVKITLKFSDATVLTKHQPARYFQEEGNFEGYVTNLLKGNIAIEFITYEGKPKIHRSVVQRVRSDANTDNQRNR